MDDELELLVEKIGDHAVVNGMLDGQVFCELLATHGYKIVKSG